MNVDDQEIGQQKSRRAKSAKDFQQQVNDKVTTNVTNVKGSSPCDKDVRSET